MPQSVAPNMRPLRLTTSIWPVALQRVVPAPAIRQSLAILAPHEGHTRTGLSLFFPSFPLRLHLHIAFNCEVRAHNIHQTLAMGHAGQHARAMMESTDVCPCAAVQTDSQGTVCVHGRRSFLAAASAAKFSPTSRASARLAVALSAGVFEMWLLYSNLHT